MKHNLFHKYYSLPYYHLIKFLCIVLFITGFALV